MAMDGYLWMV
uniref:Solute carrier family 20 member 2 n=2 Tax=Muroidea TaxID=337687 RepID=A0A8C6W337_NANGA